MSEFKGTKGEWKVIDRSSSLESTIYSNEKRICDVKSFGSDFKSVDCNGKSYSEPSTEERKYNERLIACAPEMLEALEYFVSVIDSEEIIIKENFDNDGFENCGGRLYEMFKRLIKKATE